MMAPADLLQLEWRNPWWAVLALQPLLVSLLLRLRRQRLLHYADAHLLPWAVSAQARLANSLPRRIGHAALWLLLACALAGPRLPLPGGSETERLALPRHDIDVMIVLDVSASMRAQDVAPDRLARARLKLLDLRQRLRGERIGLIAFAGEAGLLMPATRDTALLEHYLQLAQPTLLDEPGTQLAAALRLALLQRDPARAQAVLLLTDGEASSLSGEQGNAALAAARELKAAQVPLYVLALGTAQGGTIPLPKDSADSGGVVEENGAPVVSRLDAAGFRALAGGTGGGFATVTGDGADLAALYDRGMLTLRAATAGRSDTRGWHELYAWPLAAASLLYLLLSLRRRAVLVATMALASASAGASERDAWQAYRKPDPLLAQQLYAQAQGYGARMGEGASAYRRRDYGYAAQQFTEALLIARTPQERADALFNLGNSHYYAGNKTAALESFEGVLRYRQDDKARANLARVTAQMKAASAPPGTGISGRRGRGLGQGENAGGESPMGMEAEKERPQVLQETAGNDSDTARAAPGAAAGGAAAQADVRAARKKLELVRDQPAQMTKRLLTQDRSVQSGGAARPW